MPQIVADRLLPTTAKNFQKTSKNPTEKRVKISRKVCYKALDELLKRKILKIEGETVRLTDYNEFVNDTLGDVLESDLETKQNAILKDMFDYVRSIKDRPE